MATNPPVTIGPFTNVPAPGSGVQSAWAQQITNYVLRTPWTAAPLVNGWVNFAGGAYQGARYRKVGDVVEIEGLISTGTLGQPMFTLPTGFRPPLNMQFATTSANNFAAFTVFSTGVVQNINGVNTSFQINCRFSVTP